MLKIRVNALADRGEGTALRVETAAAATRERERRKASHNLNLLQIDLGAQKPNMIDKYK